MENRRRHYRHLLTAVDRLKVTLTSPDAANSIVGVLVNLSIGGMCVESKELGESENQRWLAAFQLQADAVPIRINVERIYIQQQTRVCFGFRFLPPSNLNIREEQEKSIWKFLLEEQRNDRRRMRESHRAAG